MGRDRGLISVFHAFHGTSPKERVRVRKPVIPNELAVLGKLVSFEYEAQTEGSSRAGTHYTHTVGDLGSSKTNTEIWVCTDKTGKQIHFITVERGGGGRYPQVGSRGIVGGWLLLLLPLTAALLMMLNSGARYVL